LILSRYHDRVFTRVVDPHLVTGNDKASARILSEASMLADITVLTINRRFRSNISWALSRVRSGLNQFNRLETLCYKCCIASRKSGPLLPRRSTSLSLWFNDASL